MKIENYRMYKYWILEYGYDCDGMEARPNVYGYSTESAAHEAHQDMCEWSDGIQYDFTEDMNVVRDFCNDHNIDFLSKIVATINGETLKL